MKRVVIAAAMFAVLSLFVLPAVADFFQVRTALDETGIDQPTLARLIGTGELLMVRENSAGKLQLVTGGILINRPAATVWKTVTDYNNYAKFMPSTAECQIVNDNGNQKDVRYKIKFKFVIFSFTVNYVLRTYFRPMEEITWNLLSCEDNKIRTTYGSWRFIPINGGTQTAAFYSVYSDITGVVPGLGSLIRKDPTMETAINASTVLLVLKAVRNRSENPAWVQPQ